MAQLLPRGLAALCRCVLRGVVSTYMEISKELVAVEGQDLESMVGEEADWNLSSSIWSSFSLTYGTVHYCPDERCFFSFHVWPVFPLLALFSVASLKNKNLPNFFLKDYFADSVFHSGTDLSIIINKCRYYFSLLIIYFSRNSTIRKTTFQPGRPLDLLLFAQRYCNLICGIVEVSPTNSGA